MDNGETHQNFRDVFWTPQIKLLQVSLFCTLQVHMSWLTLFYIRPLLMKVKSETAVSPVINDN